MARPGFQPGNISRGVPRDRGPPPNLDDYPDDYSRLLVDLVWRHGGIDKFTPVQREAVAAVAALMVDLRSCQPADLVKRVEAMTKLEAQLPPAMSVRAESAVPQITDGMSLQECANLYARTLADADGTDPGDRVPQSAPVVNAIADAPQPPTRAPEPAEVIRASPEPEDAPVAADTGPEPAEPATVVPLRPPARSATSHIPASESRLQPAGERMAARWLTSIIRALTRRGMVASDSSPVVVPQRNHYGPPPPCDNYQPEKRRHGRDPFDEAGIVGHLRGGYSFRGGRR
jgi:hypothetical protein